MITETLALSNDAIRLLLEECEILNIITIQAAAGQSVSVSRVNDTWYDFTLIFISHFFHIYLFFINVTSQYLYQPSEYVHWIHKGTFIIVKHIFF